MCARLLLGECAVLAVVRGKGPRILWLLGVLSVYEPKGTSMAQRVHVVLVDDIDGTDADETVTFALDGTGYEIDLTEAHASALREALAPYVGHARKADSARSGRRGRRTGSRAAATGGPSATEVREWARANGFEVSDRGRVSATVRDAYDAAH